MKDKINNLLKKKILILDGATGTELHKRGLPSGVCPEAWCLKNPKILQAVQRDYYAAGSDIVYTCTFGANRAKLTQYGIKDIISTNRELVKLTQSIAPRQGLVAGDIGPLGKFIEPFGDLGFEEAVEIFKEQTKGLLLGGVDLFVIETMMDIQEARAAVLAVKELTDKFCMVTMTFEESGRTLNGNDPLSCLITLQSLGADAFGCNCSTGPQNMLKVISQLKPYAKVPLVAKPNAGAPKLINNKTVFNMKAEEFAGYGSRLARAGANILGGCCGTSPEYIKHLKESLSSKKPRKPLRTAVSAITSARKTLVLSKGKKVTLIGEKINPTGKKQLQQELLSSSLTLPLKLAKEQELNGAAALDINVGVPGINEPKCMHKIIAGLSVASTLPLVIDSSSISVIEEALRIYPGRALINSISAEKEKLKKLLIIAKKYGAMFIALPIASRKIPLTFQERKPIIIKIIKEAKKAGFSNEDIIIDALAMTISSYPNAAKEALKTIQWCSKTLKCNTIVGLSNISFGFPKRHLINKVFLNLAKNQGLSIAIADPLDNQPVKNKLAEDLLLNRDKNGEKFISFYATKAVKEKALPKEALIAPAPEKAYTAILEGDKGAINSVIASAINSGIDAAVLMQKYMIPAIVKVGDLFEKKEYFLPQLIASAETMKRAINILEPHLKSEKIAREKKAIILLATVKGDIHDIGKNIVALILRNHGFEIIDIGKDVSSSRIIKEIKRYHPDIVGLSALMTTTMVNMKEVISLAKKEGLHCKFMLGGAVLSKAYAVSIGATYARNAVEAVHVAASLFNQKNAVVRIKPL
jgi:5-methyltetrahydrofolate--homocysteine methyltransferase